MLTPRRTLLALLAAVPLGASGCADTTAPTPTLDCWTLATNLATTTDLQATPSGLRYRDVVIGSGAPVVAGSRVVTNYSACSRDGIVFSEVDYPSLFTFTAGGGTVVAGLDEGVQGMKLGGRRQLVIPPALGYGTNGSPGGFPVPNDTIVLTVDAIGLR